MDSSIGAIGSKDYNSVINSYQTDSLKNNVKIKENASDEEMMQACKEFEVYMVEQIYKSAEKTIMKADEEENEYEEYFGDMRIHNYAQAVSDQGKIGLANQLYESMKRNQGVSVIKE